MSAPATRRLTRRVSWETLLAILLVAAIAAGGILNPDFLSAANWTNLLANFVEIALMALPLCLIVIAKEIDLSVASILGLSSVRSWECFGKLVCPCRLPSCFACWRALWREP